MARRGGPKKLKKVPVEGIVHVHTTFNNTIVTITDKEGNVITWASGGTIGYKGTKKGTPFAAGLAARDVARKVYDAGMRRVEIWIKGPGPGRETAVRAIHGEGLEVTAIRDKTPIPHNGCRPPKKRRV